MFGQISQPQALLCTPKLIYTLHYTVKLKLLNVSELDGVQVGTAGRVRWLHYTVGHIQASRLAANKMS